MSEICYVFNCRQDQFDHLNGKSCSESKLKKSKMPPEISHCYGGETERGVTLGTDQWYCMQCSYPPTPTPDSVELRMMFVNCAWQSV